MARVSNLADGFLVNSSNPGVHQESKGEAHQKNLAVPADNVGSVEKDKRVVCPLTAMLGMLPLLQDAFFVAMAVTIVFGLGFVTVLTLLVVPTLYAVFLKVDNPA